MVAPGHYNVAADGSKDVERESCRKFFPLLSSYYVQRPLVCCWRRRGGGHSAGDVRRRLRAAGQVDGRQGQVITSKVKGAEKCKSMDTFGTYVT